MPPIHAPTRPGAGDVFATAVDITISGGAIGDATCYTNAYTDVSTPGDASASPDHDVFYAYTTGPCAQSVDVELCGGDVLHLLDASGAHLATGDATLPAFCGAITNGSSLIAFPVAPNTLYHIVVEADAEFIISVEENDSPDSDNDGLCDAADPCPNQAPGAGDVFATAVDITVSGGAVGDATCYSNAYTDVSTPGDASASGDHDVFYSYTTGACALTIDVELCGGDVLHLLDASGAHLATGDATLPAFCGAITNGSSLIAFPVAPNTLYHIVVEADAEFIISVEENDSPDSDNDGLCDAADPFPNRARCR
ncbi:MAG: hypothetical protein IPO90_11550 [Flavobacteriales bacterium]|nr:hypothetical protein [Flavobacteriales bacterium]